MHQQIEKRLKAFEVLGDLLLPPELFTLVRLSCPSLESLARHQLGFDFPFDARLGKALVKAASTLFAAHDGVLFCHVCGDELTFLLELDTHLNRRSPLAVVADFSGGMSARLSHGLAQAAPCRATVYALPTPEVVQLYFLWRQSQLRASAFRHHYVRVLGGRGVDIESARQMVEDIGADDLAMVLQENGIEESDIPAWQRNGTGLYRRGGHAGTTELLVDTKLPAGEALRGLLANFLE